jgi:peptidoglycan/xylan/chitin deacetylase (PgdA/CDA1 family)
LIRNLARRERILKDAAAFAFRWSGVPFLIRHGLARNRISILLYHDPDPEMLRAHLTYLTRRYTFVTLDEAVRVLRSGTWSELPSRALVITLDDGHRGNARLTKIFTEHGVTPTIYVCSQIVATSRHFWFLKSGVDVDRLKTLPQDERLALLAQAIGFSPAREYPASERQALSQAEIAEMAQDVRFESHSRFHPILPTCSDAEAATEIELSRQEVDALTGQLCRHFSFPNGYYGRRELDLVRMAGYLSARTVDIGWNGPKSDPFTLKIVGQLGNNPREGSLNMLVLHLSGLGYLPRLIARARRAHGALAPGARAS